ncbi:MAG: serine O-acetyltransferase [Verrucomicrobia bacterium]|nr:serine O-acetyltransferase [Verrucomicrobiota bacterium]
MEHSHEESVSALLASYREIGGINHLDAANLPSKSDIAAICSELLQLLFPGFFAEEVITAAELPMITAEHVASVRGRLCAELGRSLRYKHGDAKDHRTESARICQEFFRSLPAVRKLLQTDVEAAYQGDPAALCPDEIILAYPGLEAIAIQRLAHVLYRDEVPLIPRMMTEWAHGRTGIDMHPGAQIGSHFFIDHGTGVVIGETCEIGSHVKLYQGVGLVARSLAAGQGLKGKKRHPTLEDHVTVYAGSTIVGGDTVIGKNSTIGANTFVMKSVPPDTLLVPGEQVQRTHNKKIRRGDASGDGTEFTI